MIFAEESSNIQTMFTNISWKEYSIFIVVAVFIYYLIIVIAFYKNEIYQLIANLGLSNNNPKRHNTSDTVSKNKNNLDSIDTESSDDIIQLQEKIKLELERARQKRSVREELIMSLQLVLKNCTTIKKSQYKDSINDFIKESSKNICSIHLNDEEVEQLWFR